jgi:hypothetical protein
MMASRVLDDASKWLIGHALDAALAIANHAMRSGQKHKLRTFFPSASVSSSIAGISLRSRRYGLVKCLAPVAAVARMLAHAAGRRGQGIIHNHRQKRLLQTALFVKLQVSRNVHVQRATVLAGRQRQFLAHSRWAAMRQNMVLKFIAEVSQRCQHRIRRRLPQPAQRALADVAAQLVQQLQVLRSARSFGHAIQDAQAFVQSHAEGNAFTHD